MKHVLMILVLLSGFAISESTAQANCKPANCKPCPPECCISNCCISKGSAASVSGKSVDVAYAAFLSEDVGKDNKACTTMSRKEMKACIAACKNQTAGSSTPNCKPTSSTTLSVVLPTEQKVAVQKVQ